MKTHALLGETGEFGVHAVDARHLGRVRERRCVFEQIPNERNGSVAVGACGEHALGRGHDERIRVGGHGKVKCLGP